MRKLVLLALLAASSAGLLAQSVQVPVMQTVIPGIGASWAGEVSGCPGVVANASSISRSNYYHSVGVTSASGTWSVALNYSDVSCLGPWVSFGSASQITQASNPSIAYGNGNHRYIQISITGNAVVTYTAMQTPFLSTSVGSVAFPVTLGQGGTGGTTSAVGLANLLSGNSQGGNTNKVQMAGVISGGPGTPLCIDVLGNDTTSGCAPLLPTGTQTQFLQIAPNTGNSTTLRMVSLPTVQASDYAFTPQAPGGSLSIGSNVIALAPVPVGVNGSDLNHYLYISGGSGTAESVIIIGGTAVSAAASGTVIVTCVNTHTGAWTVGPSAGGLIEALTAASAAGGGTVVVPNGTTVAHSHIPVPSNVTLQGVSQAGSVIQLAAGGWPNAESGPFYFVNSSTPEATVVHSTDGATNVLMRDFTLDLNGSNNSGNAFGNDILLVNCVDCAVKHVSIINGHHQGAASAGIGVNASNDVWDNVTIHMSATSPCEGGILSTVLHSQIVHSYADGLCDAGFIANGSFSTSHDILIDDDHEESTLAAAPAGCFGVEGASNITISNSTCKGPANSGSFYLDNFGVNINNVQLVNDTAGSNAAGSPTIAINIDPSASNTISNVSVVGGNYQAAYYGVDSTPYSGTPTISNLSIVGAIFTGGISGGIIVGPEVVNALLVGNQIHGGTGDGIYTYTGASGTTILGNTITGNSVDISDNGTGTLVCYNATDTVYWNHQCNLTGVARGTSNLSNGANENVSSLVSVGTNPNFPLLLDVSGPTGAFSIGGFANPMPGKVVYLWNPTGQTMTINHADSGSLSANQINTPTGAAMSGVIGAVFIYDSARTVWNMVSSVPGGGANPMTTAGDFIYGGASGTPTRLGQPGNGLWGVTFASSVPAWTALGTAATVNTGASGHTIPYLDVPNAWSATQSVASLLASGIVDGATPMAVSTTTPVSLGGTYNSGYTLNEHATPGQAIVFNLPTAAPGKQYCVGNAYNGSNPNTGTLDLQTSAVGQYIIFTDGTLSATGGYVISGGAAADAACVIGVDSTHWLLYVQRGSWSRH